MRSKISKEFIDKHPLIGYMVGGYPNYDENIKIIKSMIEGGVDILEIGIPFSDPIADGPTIQRAYFYALSNGITPDSVFHICKEISKEFDTPLIIMTYLNIVHRIGYKEFVKRMIDSKVSGLIIPDLVAEESHILRDILLKEGIDLILLASPNTSVRRLKLISSLSTGFLYLVSVYGITGERESYEEYTRNAIKTTKKYSKVPVAVGFGISKPEHVRFMLDSGADGVIIGSAFINAIDKGIDLRSFTKMFKESCKR